MDYHILKLIHIVSATLMIGAGIGSAFYLFLSYKRYQASTLKDVLKLVVMADSVFTAPSIIIQFITGLMLSNMLSLTSTDWFLIVMGVSGLILVMWLRAAFLQIKLRKILEKENEITPEFHYLMKVWFYLGVPSFLGALYLYYLMVYKPFV
ncbi:MAG: DUF2269 domain-containing protein [Flavobacteriales bacterium]|nr:DUF2269 domain-containing protein [Flavobacteriales bacterium]